MESVSTKTADLFPPKPKNVPPKLAAPSLKYQWHAWLALGGLALFGLAYLGLIVWFSWSAWRLFSGMGEANGIWDFIKGFCAAVLAVFLVKGLFFKSSSGKHSGYQITAQDQPRLFEFLNRVADEAGAPRPHKVFLSASVNACVFYDLSLLNFIFPTRKNLDIGLGLINVVTLSELKAILAHEFGHFAQKSMAVGRWVYTAQQVATQLVYHRDALDTFLNFISAIDLRIAWIGWLLRLVVWSLRSILDSLLSLVMLAERALSREMEFQADLVAVSTSGSDALIHGLFRLPAADEAWEEAKEFIDSELGEGYKTEDVFAIQSRIIEHQQRILDDPDFGSVPPLPSDGREQHRIFNADIAQPPQMWATHPQSHLREENAKATYVSAELDERSAWLVFDEPEKLRKDLSRFLFEELEQKDRPLGETLAELDKSYRREYYNPKYRGVYLQRSVVSNAKSVEELFQCPAPASDADLYPESLTDDLEKMRNLSKEKALLVALRDRTFETADGIIRFRGNVIKRSGLGAAITQSTEDLEGCQERLLQHDRRCRAYHLEVANSCGESWSAFLRGLMGTLHYTDHSIRNLADANRKLMNTFHIVVADGNVSSNELQRLLRDAFDVYNGLNAVYEKRFQVSVDEAVKLRLNGKSWSECLEEKFQLPPPSQENISDWLQASGGWVGATCGSLAALREAALEELLETEAHLVEARRNNVPIPENAPLPGKIPAQYDTLLPGEERELQTKLNWWDSFQTASGFGPGMLRFVISFAIVALAIYITLPPEWANWLKRLGG